jgi:hypothetical protein
LGVPDNDNVNMDSASAPPACCDVNDFMTGLAKNIWFRMGKGIVVRMDAYTWDTIPFWEFWLRSHSFVYISLRRIY